MKKLLVLILAMLFVGVGIASASSTLTMSGDYYVKGTWYDNRTGTDAAEPKESFGQYDHEMTLDMVFAMTPYTKVAARLELRDEIWGVATGATETNVAAANEQSIYVEELYGQHTFMNHHTVKVGLVKTSTWASDFNNNKVEAFRVQYSLPTPAGYAIFFTEKQQPSDINPLINNGVAGDIAAGETLGLDADNDSYVAMLITKVGSVNVKPLIAYLDYEGATSNGNWSPVYDFEVWSFDLGLDGTLNNVGWEAELVYTDYSYDSDGQTAAVTGYPGIGTFHTDYAAWGAYFHAWTQMDALKLGGYIAHGSYDEDVNKGFAFGTEFDGNDDLMPGRTMLLGDEVVFVSGTISSADMLALYGTYNVNEKLSVTLFGAYLDSNVDRVGTQWDGANAMEFNVIGEYKITPLLTYAAGAAWATVEYGDGVTPDPDAAIEISHRLAFTF